MSNEDPKKSLWGVGLTIAIVFFMLVTVGLVVFSAGLSFDQVTETHYEDASIYQDRIEALQRTRALSSPIYFALTKEQLHIALNANETNVIDSVKIQLYKPDDGTLDRFIKFPSVPASDTLAFDFKKVLAKGSWTAKIQWWAGSKAYYAERERVF